MTENVSLVARQENGLATVTPDQWNLVKATIAKDATDDELKLYIHDCLRRGVNPLDRMIHFTKRGGKYTPVTGIDFMRARAAETGEYAGNDDATFAMDAKGNPFSASVTVYRIVQGTRVPFSATARWSEYYPGDAQGHMWRKMPYTMLAKCAEALALRKGFPQQLSGLYTVEEMDQATGEIVPAKVTAPAPRPAPAPAPPAPQAIDGEIVKPTEKPVAAVNPYTSKDESGMLTWLVRIEEMIAKTGRGPWKAKISQLDDDNDNIIVAIWDDHLVTLCSQEAAAGVDVSMTVRATGTWTNRKGQTKTNYSLVSINSLPSGEPVY